MNDITVNLDVNQLLTSLESLGVKIAVESKPYLMQMYAIYLRQAYIEGWMQVIGGSIVAIALGVIAYKCIKNAMENEYSTGDIGAMFSIVGAIASLSVACVGLCKILNPAYYAINNLLGLIR